MIEKSLLVERAFFFAFEKHRNQLDDDGKSYFWNHVVQVYEILVTLGAGEKILSAALLHDTIEDTDTTYEEVLVEFGQEIANLVHEVTHEGAKDEIGFYFPRLKSHDAIIIKFADRLSNLTRLDSWNPKRKEQYLRKSKFWKSEPI